MAPSSLPIHFVHPLLRARDWQDRPEYDSVAQWWRDGAPGVCALVGIGGAGKTAIVDRFLRRLPGAMETEPGLMQDPTLIPLSAGFAFSFYDAPNPEKFFEELYLWITRTFGMPDRRPRTAEGKPQQAAASLVAQDLCTAAACNVSASGAHGRLLLVLDGLEKVQDDGARDQDAFGLITHGGLRTFVQDAAEGRLPHVSILITTRFRLIDLEAFAAVFWPVWIERLSPETAVSLFRARGVSRGTDDDLIHMAEDYGLHALTIDLLGGFIANFCEGDSGQLPPEPEERHELIEKARTALSPALRALRDQERRFARVAQRYRDGMKARDQAALALLERLCLFRLGADADLLAAVFLGEGKERVSGPALAGLSRTELNEKLAWLVTLRLIEQTRPASDEAPATYNVHPAVRDGFLSGLDRDTAEAAHEAASEGYQARLPEELRENDLAAALLGHRLNPSDPAVLDLLEEIVCHTREAGHTQEAFSIYDYRMGRVLNLLWRLGACERGERICRAFAAGEPPQTTPLPEGLSEFDQGLWINEWGVYLSQLGGLAAAASCFERFIKACTGRQYWTGASKGKLNLSETLVDAARLKMGLRAAEEGLRLADRAANTECRHYSHAYRAHARALRGQVQQALDAFDRAACFQDEREGQVSRPFYSLKGIYHALLLTRLGRNEEAVSMAETTDLACIEAAGEGYHLKPKVDLLSADLARERGDLSGARELLDRACEWGIGRNAKQVLCWSALVRAKIALTEARFGQREAQLQEVREAVEDGVRIARECGYGIYHIDLLLERAEVQLLAGDAKSAQVDILTALEQGVKADAETGQPELLPAADPECGYAWGVGDARHLLAEALLLLAAQGLGSATYKPRARNVPPEVRDLVKQARTELQKCLRLRRRIQDPRAKDTERLIEDLKGGVLTVYPLERIAPQEKEIKKEESAMSPTTPIELFYSYSHKDESLRDALQTHLSLLKRQGVIAGWHDRGIGAGTEWADQIDDHLNSAWVILLLVSADFLASDYCWDVEVKRAMERHEAGEARVIPVILRKCDWQGAPFGKLQALPKDARPVTAWADKDAAFTDIARGIRRAAEALRGGHP